MKLKALLSKITYEKLIGDEEKEITGIAYDSREVVPGGLFVCIKGFRSDGHVYIDKAIEKGAAAIVVEDLPAAGVEAVVIQVKDSREALARISAAWFNYPASKMTLIGLTGTKGKTTTAHMIKGILEEAGYKTGMIGTMGAYIGTEKFSTKNTTPESYELHSLFAQMQNASCKYVVMEVSSQGLKHKRTAGLIFDYGAFLNLSPDHISEGEHADFEEYLYCKSLLFAQTKQAVVNIDDAHYKEVTAQAESPITVSVKGKADFYGSNIQNIWEPGLLGVTFHMSGRLNGDITLNMPGVFNVENALIAASITHAIGVDQNTMAAALKKVLVKGRTQLVTDASHPAAFLIDYAHNALSMESLLKMLKDYRPGRLICLFGGGGNRPKQRRYDMGEIAAKYADFTVLTMDNPRFEDMDVINAHIIEGLKVNDGKYKIIPDRGEAIRYLLDTCGEGDIVALIGKGHEEYQDVQGVKHFFSEEQVVAEYFRNK